MKKTTAFLFSLLLAGATVRAADVVDDTIKLQSAGINDAVVLAWIERQMATLLSVQQIVALKLHKVTDRVIMALVRNSENQSPRKADEGRRSDVALSEASVRNSERLKAEPTPVSQIIPSEPVLQPVSQAPAASMALGKCVVPYAPEYADDAACVYAGPVYYFPYERPGLDLTFLFGWRPHRHFYPHYEDVRSRAENPRPGLTQSSSPVTIRPPAPAYHVISFGSSQGYGSHGESGFNSAHFSGNGGLGSGISSGLRGH